MTQREQRQAIKTELAEFAIEAIKHKDSVTKLNKQVGVYARKILAIKKPGSFPDKNAQL